MNLTLKIIIGSVIFSCVAATLPACGQTKSVTPGTVLSRRAQAAIQTPEGSFIQNMGAKTLYVIDDETLTREQQKEKFHEILKEYFNLPAIAKFVIGRAWNVATPEQRQEYAKLFELTVVKMYADRLSNGHGEKSMLLGTRRENDTEYVVSSQIVHPDGAPPTKVDWRVKDEGGRFAIHDVIIEGVSQTVTKRSEYAAVLARRGGVAGLLAAMREQLSE